MKKRTLASIWLVAIAVLGVSACGGAKSKSATATETTAAASTEPATPGAENGAGPVPNCGAVQAVWVNLNTKVYHEPSDPLYGKTKHGEYLCPAQAKQQGFRPAGGGAEQHRHRKSSDPSM